MRVAPLRLRLLASAIDVSMVVGALLAVIGVVLAPLLLAFWFGRAKVHRREPIEADEREAPRPPRLDSGRSESRAERARQRARRSPELERAGRWALVTSGVAWSNHRSVGYRVVGIRRVDATSGGPVTVSSALAGACLQQCRRAAFDAALQRTQRVREHEHRRADSTPPSPDDPDRGTADRPRAAGVIVRDVDIRNAADTGIRLAALWLLWTVIPAIVSSDARTIGDRLSGTMVVVEG